MVESAPAVEHTESFRLAGLVLCDFDGTACGIKTSIGFI